MGVGANGTVSAGLAAAKVGNTTLCSCTFSGGGTTLAQVARAPFVLARGQERTPAEQAAAEGRREEMQDLGGPGQGLVEEAHR